MSFSREREREREREADKAYQLGVMEKSIQLDPLLYQYRQPMRSKSRAARLLLDDRRDAPQGISGSLVQLVVLHEPECLDMRTCMSGSTVRVRQDMKLHCISWCAAKPPKRMGSLTTLHPRVHHIFHPMVQTWPKHCCTLCFSPTGPRNAWG